MAVNRNEAHIPKKSYPAVSASVVRGAFLTAGLDPEIAKGVAGGLQKILSQQARDERINYDVIEKSMQEADYQALMPWGVYGNSVFDGGPIPGTTGNQSTVHGLYQDAASALAQTGPAIEFGVSDFGDGFKYAMITLIPDVENTDRIAEFYLGDDGAGKLSLWGGDGGLATGYLAVNVTDVTADLTLEAQSTGVSPAFGVVLDSDSAAAELTLQSGDLIVNIAGFDDPSHGGDGYMLIQNTNAYIGFLILGESDGDEGILVIKESTRAVHAPGGSHVYVFARDNGAGKTQLCARFATGAVQVLSTEP